MTLLEKLQEKMQVVDVLVACEEMAEHGSKPEAIIEMLRMACRFYDQSIVIDWLANNAKLLAYLQK